jgi:hypothetical protein
MDLYFCQLLLAIHIRGIKNDFFLMMPLIIYSLLDKWKELSGGQQQPENE